VLRAKLEESEIRRAIGQREEGDRVVEGDRGVEGVAPLSFAADRCLYFINKRVTPDLREALAARRGCIVIAPLGSANAGDWGDCLVIEAADPRAAIARVLGFIRSERRQPPLVTGRSISPTAVISPLASVEGDVEIGDGAIIEAFCTVGPDVRIGRGSIIRSGARIYPRVAIGEESDIGSNTVVGHHDLGMVRDENGNKTRIPHLGGVIIGSHVDIGALATVPSGTIAPTIVEDYAKIGDHVHVAHNVRVANNASVTPGVIVGGHAVIETNAWVGINSTIREGRRVGPHALVGMDASVQHDLAEKMVARAPRPDVRAREDDDLAGIGFPRR
jgi:UDP-3-O-[3-hydroxymyristoyl] glucosamine N-acyltransferase LpxD